MSEDKKLNENLESEEIKTEDSKLDSQDPSSEASFTKTAEELGAMNVDELMEQYDLETSKLRKLTGKVALFITIVAILMSAFHLFTAWHGTLLAMKQRSLHLIFAFTLGFALYPGFKKSSKDKIDITDWLLIILSVGVWGYIFFNVEAIALKGGQMSTTDMVLGVLAVLLTLEVTRRVVGPELPIVTIVFLLFAYFGRHMPGIFAHRGFNVTRIVSHMYMTTEGIMGTPLGVSSTFVFMFILFGSFLDKTGVGEFFIDFAYALTGSTRSGPAMTSVLSSGLMGSISGSSVANTVTTGAFTIPLMKSVGYKPHYAGAVEATASTGGQIMPPVMGAAAFIMADFTGFPYISIVKAAIIPAVLYYIAVGTMVHLEACKLGLKGMPRESLPKVSNILRKQGYLTLPLIAIIFMLVKQYPPTMAALTGIVIGVIVAMTVSLIKKDNSFTPKDILGAMEAGAKGAVGVACACACAGMIVGVVTLTGFGLKIAEVIVQIAQGRLIPTLLLTMISSIILGMGLPTTAKYIVLATMAVPAITKLGVNLMSAHLFILYFGVVADVTPPVALAAYAGAGIAGANSMKTGFQAFKLAIGAFIIPYIFVINPHLIMVDSIVGTTVNWLPVTAALPTIVTALIGTICLAGTVESYLFGNLRIWQRIILLLAAFALLDPKLLTDAIGLAALAFIFVTQKMLNKNKPAATA
ncbi:TRAP transporter permease [Peptoniphilus sp. HMSC062D09]|uniref:TRAP transporter permease n=1 Tax=Peptoniphilus TaxID=162289 RepID=UPI0008A1DF7D|nr:TRAP transporter permease [Peptoniphilus sp. HMSC062D09]OFK80680.1 C4-dicarboxylate ABC transporter permease [Peptoniphilus sp. HMSC062D09]